MGDELPTLPTKIFLAGAPRSGTSILLFALKSAFDLPGYGESHVMPAVDQMIHAFYKYMDQFSGLDRSIRMELLLSQVSLDEIKQPLFAVIHQLYARAFPSGGWVE